MLATLSFLFNIVVAYLVGSICSAIIVCRIFDLPDPRKEGSKNPGATNVLRIAGRNYALIVLLGDVLKGFLPVALAGLMGADPTVLGFTCLAAVIGHMYPVFFDYKGGKGVATAIGALLGFHFLLGITVIATWLIVAKLSRYSSLAAIVSMVLSPFYSLFAVGSIHAFPPLMILAIFVIYKHKDNISRLIDGTESKINFRKNAPLDDAINQAFFTPANDEFGQPTAPKKSIKKNTKKSKTSTLKKDETAKKSIKPAKKTTKTDKKAPTKAVKKPVKEVKKPVKTTKKVKAKKSD
jgi:glycerol-3-phosphate acyltransferase PlsY